MRLFKPCGGEIHEVRKLIGVVASAATMGAVAVGVSPEVQAEDFFRLPDSGVCNYPGTGGSSGFGGWCDYPPVLNGSHYHCEWGGMGMFKMGGCTWRDGGNAVVPPPPAEMIYW